MKVVLGFRGLDLALRSTSDALLERVLPYLSPPFSRAAGAAAAVSVEVIIDAAAYERLVESARPAGGDVDCFTLDQGHQRLPRHVTADGRVFLCDASSRVALLPAGTGAVIVAATDSDETSLIVLRTVRELATAHALALGDVPLHAAGVVGSRGATLLIGPKAAGKSTLLLHLARFARVPILANDRVLVEVESAMARGIGTVVILRAGTRAMFPDLPATPLSLSKLARILGVEVTPVAPARALVFVALDDAVGTFALEPIDPDETARRLGRDGLIAGGSQAALFARPSPAPLGARLRALAERVPGYTLRLGPRAYDDAALQTAVTRLNG